MARYEIDRSPYTVADLCELFGESAKAVRGWIDRGLLGKPMRSARELRFSERAVRRFIRDHPSEYNLARVNCLWFVMILFPEVPKAEMPKGEAA